MRTLYLFFLLYSTQSFSSEWSDVDVLDIRAFTDQSQHYIQVKEFSNPLNCKDPNYVVLMRETDNWKMVHSLILTGVISNKKIILRFKDCDNQGRTIVDGAALIK